MHRNTSVLQQRREQAQNLRDSLRQSHENADADIASARDTERLIARRSVRREAMQFRHTLNDIKDHSKQGWRRLAAGLDSPVQSDSKDAGSQRPHLVHTDYLAHTLAERLSTKYQQQANVDDGTSMFSTLARPTLMRSRQGGSSETTDRGDRQGIHSTAAHTQGYPEPTDPKAYFALLLQSEGGVLVKDEHSLHSARTFQDAVVDACAKTKEAVFTRQAVVAEVEAALRMHARLLQQLEQRVQRRQALHDAVLLRAQRRRQDAAAADTAAYGSMPLHKWPVSAQRRAADTAAPSFGEDISVIARGDSDDGATHTGSSAGGSAPETGSSSHTRQGVPSLDTAASMQSILGYSGRSPPPVGGEALREAMSGGGLFRSHTAERIRASSLETHDMRGMAMADPVLREWLLQRYTHFKWQAFCERDRLARQAAVEARETGQRLPERSTARALRRVDAAATTAVLPPGEDGASVGGAVVAAATDAFDQQQGAMGDSDSESSSADTPRAGVAALPGPLQAAGVPLLDLGAGEAGGGAEAAAAAATASDSLTELQTVLDIYRAHMSGGRHPGACTTLGAVAPLQAASSTARMAHSKQYQRQRGRDTRPSCYVDEDTGLPLQRPRIPLLPSSASLELLASASTAAGQLPLVPPLPLYPPAGDASSNAAAAMTAATVQRALHARAAPGSARARLQGRALRGVPSAVAAERPAWPTTTASQEALQTATSLTGTPRDMVPTHRNTGTLPASVTRALTHDCRLEVAWRDAGNFGAAWWARRGKSTRRRKQRAAAAAAAHEAAAAVEALDSFGLHQSELAPAAAAATARAHALPRPGDVFPGVWADGSVQGGAAGTPQRRRGALAASAAGMLDDRTGSSRVYSAVGPQWSHSIHMHRCKGEPVQHTVAALGCSGVDPTRVGPHRQGGAEGKAQG